MSVSVVSAKGLKSDKRWKIKVDGKIIEADLVEMINEDRGLRCDYGCVAIGGNKAPYAQAVLTKPGGVSTVVVSEDKQHGFLVGLIGQPRPLVHTEAPDTPVLTAPGGFKQTDESDEKSAARELQEEGGLIGHPVRTRNSRTHMDRALIKYVGPVFDEFFYAVVKPSALAGPTAGDLHNETWKYQHALSANPDPAETIVAGLQFVRGEWALDHAVDAYTKLAIFQALFSLGRINFD